MSKAGALDLASGLGGKIDKSDVLSAVDKYPYSLYARFFVSVCICMCVKGGIMPFLKLERLTEIWSWNVDES